MGAKTKAKIDECDQCKSLRQVICDAFDIAKKRLGDGDISGAIELIEKSRGLADLFLTEDHGPNCMFASLKDADGNIH